MISPLFSGILGFLAGIGSMILFNVWVINSEQSRYKKSGERYEVPGTSTIWKQNEVKVEKLKGICEEENAEVIS